MRFTFLYPSLRFPNKLSLKYFCINLSASIINSQIGVFGLWQLNHQPARVTLLIHTIKQVISFDVEKKTIV